MDPLVTCARYLRPRRPATLAFLSTLVFIAYTYLLVLSSGQPSDLPQDTGRPHRSQRRVAVDSPCRPDMEVSRLPAMSPSDGQMIADLFNYLIQVRNSTCRRLARFGGTPFINYASQEPVMDGHKWVCLDPEFGLVSSDQCLVYSFGISDEWSFDWDMEQFGCTVYAFDPSVNISTGHQNGSIMFLQYGIGEWDHRESTRSGSWEIRTLDTFVTRLGHEKRDIHFLKMDIEGAEWGVLRQQTSHLTESALFQNVQQLAMELHFTEFMPTQLHAEFFRDLYVLFLRLQSIGFYPFSFDENLTEPERVTIPGVSRNITPSVEVAWLKTKCVK